MTAQSQLEAYLGEFRKRLTGLIVARGAAIMAITAFVVTIAAVYIGIRRAFDDTFIFGARVVLLLALVALAATLLILPLRTLRRSRGIRDIEQRAPDFDGRLETYDTLVRAPERTPFLTLLAEDALELARRIPVALKVPTRQIRVPAAIAAVAVAGLVWFAAFGPDNWRYGVRHLWAGWFLDDTKPPQHIVVDPGSVTVRRGGDLHVAARAEGFEPSRMEVFAELAPGAGWERAQMTRTADGGFEFTFYALRDPMRYYVTAAGLPSPTFNVDVVDLPRVKNLKLTYHYPEWTRLSERTDDPGSHIRAVEGTEVTVEIETDQPLATPELLVNGERIAMTGDGLVNAATLRVAEPGQYYVSTLFNGDPVKVTDDYRISVVKDEKPTIKIVKPGRDWRAINVEEVTVRVEANDDFAVEGLELRWAVNGGEWTSRPLVVEGKDVRGEEVLFLEEMRQPVEPESSSSSSSALRGVEDFRVIVPRIQVPDPEPPAVPGAEPAEPETRMLEPGDVISYYAVVRDRGREVQSDLFFVEVQPYERNFTQATAAGGEQGGGGGGGEAEEQNEISRRQKEILTATWNLINERKQSEELTFLDEQALHDNALLLAEVQRTLAEQARTLANRTRARQLTGADERIATFIESLEKAADAMIPASERLAEVELDEAVAPEQLALQHLLRAESTFTDIQVAQRQQGGGGGGGGGGAGRDLQELFELEMDLEKNQYETEQRVSFDNQQPGEQEQQQIDETIRKLQELARRQEQLAQEANRRNGLTPEQRWQQEQLRREVEELRRQLEDLQQQLANAQQQQQQQQQGQQQSGSQQAQNQQQGQPGQPGQQQGQQQGQSGQQPSGQPGQQGQQQGQRLQAGAQGGQRSLDQTIENLSAALEAMERANQQNNADPAEARRAAEELQAALEQATAERQAAVQAAFDDLAERAAQAYESQRQQAEDLREALLSARDSSQQTTARRGGLTDEEAVELAERRRDLHDELEALEQDVQRVARQFRDQTPEGSETLSQGLSDLQADQTTRDLETAANYILRGNAVDVAGVDSIFTTALRNFQRTVGEARDIATQEAIAGQRVEPDPLAEARAEIQAVRRELEAIQRGQPGQPGQQQGQPGQQQGQPGQQQAQEQQQQGQGGGQQQTAQNQQGQPGQGQQPGQQPGQQAQQGGGQAGGARGGLQQATDPVFGGNFGPTNFGGNTGGWYDWRGGVWDPRLGNWWENPEAVEQARERLAEAGTDLLTLGSRLSAEGLNEEELRALRELSERMRSGLRGNPELIEQQFRAIVDLAEQLELSLAAQSSAERTSVRAEQPAQAAPGLEAQTAEYYRRLSERRLQQARQ